MGSAERDTTQIFLYLTVRTRITAMILIEELGRAGVLGIG